MAEAQLTPGDDVRAALLRTSEDFRQLVSEHHALDERVRDLSSLTYLTEQQQIEATALKKRKLAIKDRIEAIVRDRSHGGAR